jgi:cation-transporting ATPase E
VSFINAIFFVVIIFLASFGEFHEALFLSIVLVINIVIGIVQDLRAQISLERLRLLTLPHARKVLEDGSVEHIDLVAIEPNMKLQIMLGDQIPTDAKVISTEGLEVNEALLTGESKNLIKPIGSDLLGGSIVTSGQAIILATASIENTFVAKMTNKIKQFEYALSPLQQSLTRVMTYLSYVLVAIIAYEIFHGITDRLLVVNVVKSIAALTSTLVPQGLILATTVFFAYGAIKMYKQQVLLQEINAIEKLCHIENLCVDKTGTLTENELTLDKTLLYENIAQADIDLYLSAYLHKNIHTSQTSEALLKGIKFQDIPEAIEETITFSSTKKYGAVFMEDGKNSKTIVLGAPDVLMRFLPENQKAWITKNTTSFGKAAKRLVLLATANGKYKDLNGVQISSLALFVLNNPLRPGTTEIISFFQDRGVKVRVISGDSPETVKAIAEQAGIKHIDLVITGDEIAALDEEAFAERVPAYHVFARIYPEQKEKIITLLKKSGFTAMVGDGANDALAIKRADLGIAMFDGASATRQIAQVVLINNSFAALPKGVEMAETILSSIELVASVFFNKIVTGLILFITIAFAGFLYPLSPRNDTIIGYSTIWCAILFWSLFPAQKINIGTEKSFFKSILPFAITMGALTAAAASIGFALEQKLAPHLGGHTLVTLVIMLLGFWFIYLSPLAYGIITNSKQTRFFYLLSLVLTGWISYVFSNKVLQGFFNLPWPGFIPIFAILAVIALFGYIQLVVTKKFFALSKK